MPFRKVHTYIHQPHAQKRVCRYVARFGRTTRCPCHTGYMHALTIRTEKDLQMDWRHHASDLESHDVGTPEEHVPPVYSQKSQDRCTYNTCFALKLTNEIYVQTELTPGRDRPTLR